MKIQQVERQTGISAQSIRFYEREGLILPQRDSGNRYRIYSPEDVEELRSIAFCRRLGISIPEIRAMLQADCTFQQCVERAMAEAEAEKAEAAARAALCRSVLQELSLDPEKEPADCARSVLRDRSVRKLYAQVIPEEQRRPAKQHYWLLYPTVIPVVLVGILVVAAIVVTGQFRPARDQMIEMLVHPEAEITFSCEGTSIQSEVLENKLTNLLMRTAPTTHLPWCKGETEPVKVEVISGQETALVTMWERNGKVCLRWETPEKILRWTLLDYDIHNLYRQIKSDIGRCAKEMAP